MQLTHYPNGGWVIKVRSEGHPVHDPQYVRHIGGAWSRFLRNAFGQNSEIDFSVKLEAGNRQDGTPAEQLIILPTIGVDVNG
jgi:hypothetical protein